MDKNIGFRRNIYLNWMDAAAAYCIETPDPAELRARLDPVVAQQIASPKTRRIALDILVTIWGKSVQVHPALHTDAVALFTSSSTVSDRVWLHYGMTLLIYGFFPRERAGHGPAQPLPGNDHTQRGQAEADR
jgi:hypothetical protein